MFIWDENKNATNKAKHGIGFDSVYEFDWETEVIMDRSRHGDGESRYAAVGYLYGKLHTVIYTLRGKDVRIISLRRSNKPEEKSYEKTIK